MGERLVLGQRDLLVDIGNSSIKYAWYNKHRAIADLQVMRISFDQLGEYIEMASSLYFSSVLNDASNDTVIKLANQNNVPVYQCKSAKQDFNIQNAYNTPQNMGDDRWMAIIAGCALCDMGNQTNVLIIDAGSAITCDFVIANEHIGGWIAPGFKVAREAVVSSTSRVFDTEQSLYDLRLGADTPQCVSNGVVAQLSGMIHQAIFIMQQNCQRFEIYISGGDAKLLINVLEQTKIMANKYSVNFIENLVLVGLAKIANEKPSKIK